MKGRRKRKRDGSQADSKSRKSRRRGTPETDDGETDLDYNGRRKKPKSSKKSKMDDMDNFLDQFNAEDSEYLDNEEDDGLIEPELVPLRIEDDDDNYIAPLSYKQVKEWQYQNHPRDPETREPYDWWEADIKFIPIYPK